LLKKGNLALVAHSRREFFVAFLTKKYLGVVFKNISSFTQSDHVISLNPRDLGYFSTKNENMIL
jgi:hypothetical protein